MWVWAAVFVAVAGLAVPALGQQGGAGAASERALAESVERLKALRQEIEAKRKKAEDLGGEEKSALAEIRHLEEGLGLTKRILRKLDQREGALAWELSATQSALDDAVGRLEWRKEELAKTLRQMYVRGRYRSLEVLFSSKSFPNLLERFRFLGAVAKRNRQILREVDEERGRIDETRRVLLRRSEDLEDLKREKKQEQGRIELDVGRRTRLLRGIQTEKSKYERMAAESERAAAELEALIARMEAESRRRAAGPGDFEARKGDLRPPVAGEVVVAFGKHRHPKFGTVTFSNGVDYRAKLGEPVIAVAAAEVEHISWLTGYGQCVILSHGDGYYTLYAHLSEVGIEVRQRVSEGERIASVGETGSLIGPCLHFEVRRGRQALNPAEWVRSR